MTFFLYFTHIIFSCGCYVTFCGPFGSARWPLAPCWPLASADPISRWPLTHRVWHCLGGGGARKKILVLYKSGNFFFGGGSKIFKKHCFRVRGPKFLVVKNTVFWPQKFYQRQIFCFTPDPKSRFLDPPPQKKIPICSSNNFFFWGGGQHLLFLKYFG